MFALKTEGLSRRFYKLSAVTDLSLEVQAGDIYGFLGLNGAGKTTTIRMLLNLIRPDSGHIYFYDKELRANYLAIMAHLGGLVDIPAFYASLSGRRNIALLARIRGLRDSGRVSDLLQSVGLLARADDRVKTYSQGMRQRLGIAAALLPIFAGNTVSRNMAPVIILDEPTNGLDPRGIIDIRNLIKRLNSEYKATFIISTHLLSEVERLCNRVGIIQEGRLIVQGALTEVLKDKKSLEEYFI
jgi:ABC-2 type transport system ATP-binding protein